MSDREFRVFYTDFLIASSSEFTLRPQWEDTLLRLRASWNISVLPHAHPSHTPSSQIFSGHD